MAPIVRVRVLNCTVKPQHYLCTAKLLPELKPEQENNIFNETLTRYIIPGLCVLGVMLNIITIIIICRKRLWNSTSLYLTALGIVDLLGLVFIFLLSKDTYKIFGHQLEANVSVALYYYQICLDMVLLASNWLTIVLGVERYLAICHPVVAKVIYSTNRARIITSLVCLISVIVYIPNFFMRYPHFCKGPQCFNASGNDVAYIYTALGRSSIFKAIQRWVLEFVLFILLPVIILSTVNIRLIIEVRRSTDFIRKHSGISLSNYTQRALGREETKIATMLICLISVFFLCQLPILLHAFIVGDQNPPKTEMTLRNIAVFVYVIKSDVNFAFYCWLCDRFLRTIKNLVCMHCVYYLPFLRGRRGHVAGNSNTRSSRLSHNGSTSLIRYGAPNNKETTAV